MLVGNKCDLENQRKISFEDGLKFSSDFNCPFYEASAKIGKNCEEIF